MTDHERSIRLAALAISEPLDASDARTLDAHLSGCRTCRRERAAFASDHGRLQALVAPRPMATSTRTAVLAAARRPRDRTLIQLLIAAVLILLLVVAAVALSAGGRTGPALPAGFAGSWTAFNCATHYTDGSRIDCAKWGDGSTIALDIGPGDPATVRVSTNGRPSCSGSGTRETTPPEEAEGTFLWFEVGGSSCGLIALGDDLASHLYLEPNDRRIWFDDDGDGWGLFWIRAG